MKNESNMSFERTSTLEELKKAFYESQSYYSNRSYFDDDDDYEDETDNF